MIYASIRMIVEDHQCICDKTIVLYRGDKNVELRFAIKGNRFTVLESTRAQLMIRRPSATSVFSDIVPIENDTVVFVITAEMIDELRELGDYSFQVRLYDESMNARATLPPCEGALIVKAPLVVENESLVNLALVNTSLVTDSQALEIEIFTEDGRYIVTEWMNGDIITDVKLNKLEQAIYELSGRSGGGSLPEGAIIPTRTSQLENDSGFITHIPIEYITEAEMNARGYLTEIPIDYVTEQELDEKGYLTEHQDISGLVSKEELDEMNYVSEESLDAKLESDGYLTELDMGDYLSKDEFAPMDALINKNAGDIFTMAEKVDKNTNDISTILGIIDEPPSYTRPAVSVSITKNPVEHNIDTQVTISPKFTKNDAGAITGYTLTKGGQTVYTDTTANSFTETIKIAHGGSLTYRATVSYGDGPVKNTMLGIPYPQTSIKAGSISYDLTVRAYALSYYGVINNSTISNPAGLSSTLRTTKGSTLTFDLTNQRIVYMYPSSFGNLTSIKDANNFDYINSYTFTTMQYNGVNYNVYILTDPVTITGFKQIYS